MRYVVVPNDVVLQDFVNNRPIMDGAKPLDPYTMVRYLLQMVLVDPMFAKERKDIKACRALRKAFMGAKAGDVVALEDAHWDRLKTVVDKPSPHNFPPALLEQLVEFMDAVMDAKDEDPRLKQG